MCSVGPGIYKLVQLKPIMPEIITVGSFQDVDGFVFTLQGASVDPRPATTQRDQRRKKEKQVREDLC